MIFAVVALRRPIRASYNALGFHYEATANMHWFPSDEPVKGKLRCTESRKRHV